LTQEQLLPTLHHAYGILFPTKANSTIQKTGIYFYAAKRNSYLFVFRVKKGWHFKKLRKGKVGTPE
jgi:hypothetical protein